MHSAGMISLTAIAALGNPRTIPKSKMTVIDAQIYIGSSSCESLLGALRYFNARDLHFAESAGLYLINTTANDYSFIGDINWIVPLEVPQEVNDSTTFSIDLCQRALVHVSGLATNCQKEQGSFDLDLEHYVSALKDTKHVKAFAPLTCIIPDSPRYKNGKPVPYNHRYISAFRFLTNIIFKPSSDVAVDRFVITIEDITFMGQLLQANNSVHANTLDTPAKPPRMTRSLISYGKRQAQPLITPVTPAPTAKRPLADAPATSTSNKRTRRREPSIAPETSTGSSL
ncbi:hypothetical protein BDZ97DRAFT_1903666 [Flammula alnicola]|nr:hypothetical protein BDZ97DRAFT_1903666 [Flammula alnicola]